MTQNSLVADLQAIVGPDYAQPPNHDDHFDIDGISPAAIVKPGSYAQVAEVMRYANTQMLAIVPLGGGTKRHIGNIPSRYDIALSLSRMKRVVEHEPGDMTLTCEAGISLTQLSTHLEAHGQVVPLDPALHDTATIGGTLAVNAWGARRHAFGSPRDFTIGMRVVTGDGRITTAGGRVVKNVAGYDLCKLYIGSMGTLGVIIETTFKLTPLPKVEKVIVVGAEFLPPLLTITHDLIRRGLPLWANVITPFNVPPHHFLLWLWLAGTEAGVNRSVKEVESLVSASKLDSWESVDGQFPFSRMWWAALEWDADKDEDEPGLAMVLSVLPNHVAGAVDRLSQALAPHQLGLMPTLGMINIGQPFATAAEAKHLVEVIGRIASQFGGTLTITHCDPELKRRIDVFGEPPPAFDLMRRIKQQFDPNGILSPGRFVGRL
jgi:glycolate oxidase FAD binding subunit